MKILVNVLIVALLSGFSFCSVAPKPAPLGTYNVEGHDFAGNLIFKGTIQLTDLERGNIRGQCNLKTVSVTFEKSVTKDGPCGGRVSGEEIRLDLAPDMDDGGALIEGRWNDDHIEGTWSLDSFAGARTFGTFKATRILTLVAACRLLDRISGLQDLSSVDV